MTFSKADINQTVPARFEHVASRFPERVALVGKGQSWTYDALNRRANRIAGAITEMTRPGNNCVAVLLDHSPDAIIAALAVLKAGKISLAIHPGLPVAAQRAVVDDAKPQALLTSAAGRARAADLAGGTIPVLVLDDVSERVSDANPALAIGPDEHAVIYYTSGTTGRPKGVVKSHRAVLHRAWLYTEETAVTPDDRTSLLTACSFASSESDTFGALLNGAALCVFDIAAQGLAAFREWLERERITLLHPPVLLFRRFLESLAGRDLFPLVRVVALSGDALIPSDVDNWKRCFGRTCVLLHRFSISETGLLTVGRIESGAVLNGGAIPAGRPVADKLLTLDNESGELIVKSRYIADGYWNRPEETAGAFTSDPGGSGERIYRTGDLGRFLPDGSFVHLGRRDHQVKIRGFRVDLREIEEAVRKLPAVREAAVVAQQGSDETLLFAFVVPTPGAASDVKSLRDDLLKNLPDWKIPARFEFLDALPVTATGKVDRARLGRMESKPARSAARPGASIEEQIAEVWKELLGRDSVGLDDNFFELGGNSIRAMVMLYRLEQRFGVRVDPAELYRCRSLRQLAERIRAGVGAPQNIVALRADGRRAPLFIVHSPAGEFFWSEPIIQHLDADQPVYAICPFIHGDTVEPFASLPELAARYARALCAFQPEGSFRLFGYSLSGRIAYELACQLDKMGRRVSFLGILDTEAFPRTYAASQVFLPFFRHPAEFLKNIPYYFTDLVFGTEPADRAAFYKIKWKWFTRYLRELVSRSHHHHWDYNFEDGRYRELLPVHQKLWKMLSDALRDYEPRPYPGPLSLFRNRARALLRPIASDFGWSRLARGGVSVYRVPRANHKTLIVEPCVRVLADHVKRALQIADA